MELKMPLIYSFDPNGDDTKYNTIFPIGLFKHDVDANQVKGKVETCIKRNIPFSLSYAPPYDNNKVYGPIENPSEGLGVLMIRFPINEEEINIKDDLHFLFVNHIGIGVYGYLRNSHDDIVRDFFKLNEEIAAKDYEKAEDYQIYIIPDVIPYNPRTYVG